MLEHIIRAGKINQLIIAAVMARSGYFFCRRVITSLHQQAARALIHSGMGACGNDFFACLFSKADNFFLRPGEECDRADHNDIGFLNNVLYAAVRGGLL